jgi:hypothetical protein
MSNTNTGGPAFPCEWDYINSSREAANGMTLRDYFAAKASEEDIQAHIWKGFNEVQIRTALDGKKYETSAAATWTREQAKYLYADAMLKARDE